MSDTIIHDEARVAALIREAREFADITLRAAEVVEAEVLRLQNIPRHKYKCGDTVTIHLGLGSDFDVTPATAQIIPFEDHRRFRYDYPRR